MVRILSTEELNILRHEFDQYDIDKGGKICVEEFGRVMRASDKNITDEEVAHIIREVDVDGDGSISFDEFVAMMSGSPVQTTVEPLLIGVPGEVKIDGK